MRLDTYLVEIGKFDSRTKAKQAIERGEIYIDGTKRDKPSYDVPFDFCGMVEYVYESSFVSLGGYKLEKAFEDFKFTADEMTFADVGASTGGFTDCLLQHGARRVFAVDAGRGQLVPVLAEDARVLSLEQYNARYMKREDFPTIPTFAVMDVSFISATLILPALSALLPIGAPFVCLIKPQFEVGREGLGKGGIVRDKRFLQIACDRVIASAAECGFTHLGTIDSPILGGDGNREFLAAFRKEKE